MKRNPCSPIVYVRGKQLSNDSARMACAKNICCVGPIPIPIHVRSLLLIALSSAAALCIC